MDNFFQAGGSLPADSKSYIYRKCDDTIFNYLVDGKYCYVLTARQMGKSSLRVKVTEKLKEKEIQSVNIDLTNIGSTGTTTDQWYYSLLSRMCRSINVPIKLLRSWWKENLELSPVNRFSTFIDEIFLNQTDTPTVIFIDEIDYILSFDKNDFSTDDFFAVIRHCYNSRADDQKYNNLTFCLLGVATPNDLMQDPTRTPFNIASPVELDFFNEETALPLIDGLSNLNPPEIDLLTRVLFWTGGQPYLTQKICSQIVQHPEKIKTVNAIDETVRTLFLDEESDDHNLKNVNNRILLHDKYNIQMLELFQRILKGDEIESNDKEYAKLYLKLSGVVKVFGEKLVIANEIYRQSFNKKWLVGALNFVKRPFSEDMQRWIELGRPESAALRGEILKNALDWAETRDDLTQNEHEYLTFSRMVHQTEKSKELELTYAEKLKARNRFLSGALILTLLTGAAAVYFAIESNKQTAIAKQKEQLATNKTKKLLETIETLDDHGSCTLGVVEILHEDKEMFDDLTNISGDISTSGKLNRLFEKVNLRGQQSKEQFETTLKSLKQTENKTAENKTAENKTAENKTAENKTAENKTAENKTAENKTAENKTAENKTAENKTAENKTAENKIAENKIAENKIAENKIAENKIAENKIAENKTAENKTAENKIAENKIAENKIAENKIAENKIAHKLPPELVDYQVPEHIKTNHPELYRVFSKIKDSTSLSDQILEKLRKLSASTEVISALLNLTYKKINAQFYISGEMTIKNLPLIVLILVTESMDHNERQYWFDIMPSMTDSQINRLYEILNTERSKLIDLEKRYQNETRILNNKNSLELINSSISKIKNQNNRIRIYQLGNHFIEFAKLHNKELITEAEKEIFSIRNRFENADEYYYILSKFYTAQDDIDNTIHYLKKALQIKPSNIQYLIDLSDTYYSKNNYTSSRKYYKKVISMLAPYLNLVQSKNAKFEYIKTLIKIANTYTFENKPNIAHNIYDYTYNHLEDLLEITHNEEKIIYFYDEIKRLCSICEIQHNDHISSYKQQRLLIILSQKLLHKKINITNLERVYVSLWEASFYSSEAESKRFKDIAIKHVKESIFHIKKLIKLIKTNNNIDNLNKYKEHHALLLGNLSYVLTDSLKLSEAKIHIDKSIEIATEIKEFDEGKRLSNAYASLAEYYFYSKKPHQAILATKKSMSYNEHYHETLETSLATYYLFNESIEKAIPLFNKYIGKNKSVPNQSGHGRPWNNLLLESFDRIRKKGMDNGNLKKITKMIETSMNEE